MFLSELLAELESGKVSYCVVGGVAVNLHGIPRMTYDVDLVLDLTEDNLFRAEQVFLELGLELQQPVAFVALADPSLRQQLRDERHLLAVTYLDSSDPLREVDVLVNPSLPASDLVARATRFEQAGMSISVVSVDDLIELKRGSERAQDQDDARLLEQIRDSDDEDS